MESIIKIKINDDFYGLDNNIFEIKEFKNHNNINLSGIISKSVI